MKSLKHLQQANWNIPLNKVLYDAEINRKNPSAILFMIDQSASMGFEKQFYKGEDKTFAQIVADMVNEMLNELIGRCTKSEGVRDYFEICVLGYGGTDNKTAIILWEGSLKGKKWVSISGLKKNAKYEKRTYVKNIRGKTKITEMDVPYWFKAVAKYGTPMGAAFDKAHELLNNWIKDKKHENSYPPVVINITDGAQTDCNDSDLVEAAQRNQVLNTKDGHVLVLNCHIATNSNSVIFPISENELSGDKYSKMLFQMSSVMPQVFSQDISKLRNDADIFSGYHGMAYNANMDVLFNLIDIGTSGSTQQLNR
ncbi:MAG: VWA domain-containing protein [Chlorobi bacterium]|nr:VWA domain-containing protein [Chlorobiota bacterium]